MLTPAARMRNLAEGSPQADQRGDIHLAFADGDSCTQLREDFDPSRWLT
jgi:hypothetical protein